MSENKLKRKMKDRIPPYIRAKAAEMFEQGESLHQVSKRCGVSKPWATKLRDSLKAGTGVAEQNKSSQFNIYR